jgi:hypothetical protein
MRRLLPLLASFMVVLIVWSGTSAHAAEPIAPVTVEAGTHFDGDRDQVPADDHQPAPHHHGICHADHVGLPAALAPAGGEAADKASFQSANALDSPSACPGAALRPPIA